MSDSNFLASVTVRVSYEFIKFLRDNSGRGKKFRGQSEGLRYYVELGRKVDSLMEINKDPAKRKEFEEKFNGLMSCKNIENALETMTSEQWDAVAFHIETLKKHKIEQLLIDAKKA